MQQVFAIAATESIDIFATKKRIKLEEIKQGNLAKDREIMILIEIYLMISLMVTGAIFWIAWPSKNDPSTNPFE